MNKRTLLYNNDIMNRNDTADHNSTIKFAPAIAIIAQPTDPANGRRSRSWPINEAKRSGKKNYGITTLCNTAWYKEQFEVDHFS